MESLKAYSISAPAFFLCWLHMIVDGFSRDEAADHLQSLYKDLRGIMGLNVDDELLRWAETALTDYGIDFGKDFRKARALWMISKDLTWQDRYEQ